MLASKLIEELRQFVEENKNGDCHIYVRDDYGDFHDLLNVKTPKNTIDKYTGLRKIYLDSSIEDRQYD